MEIGDGVESANWVKANGVEVLAVENDEGLGLTLQGVVGKVDVILGVALVLSDAVGVDRTVVVVDTLDQFPLVGVIGKVGMLVKVVLALSDAVEDAIGTAVRIDIGVDTTSMEYAYMSSSNSFILT